MIDERMSNEIEKYDATNNSIEKTSLLLMAMLTIKSFDSFLAKNFGRKSNKPPLFNQLF